MSDKTKIEWTDATWNPVTGCTMVSAGCTNCYAMQLAGTRLKHHPSRAGLTRLSGDRPVWTGEVRFNPQWLTQPLRWRTPRRIFVCAHGDLFHESVDPDWIDQIFAVMALAPQHTFQVLTKRPDRMCEYLWSDWAARARVWVENMTLPGLSAQAGLAQHTLRRYTAPRHCAPLDHVWLGTSVEDQATASARIPHLLATPAAVRFISAEPLLGSLDLRNLCPSDAGIETMWDEESADLNEWGSMNVFSGPWPRLDWVICGGESGPDARPMHPDWARSLRDQCAAAGVAFHFKQWGEWAPCTLEGGELDIEDGAAYPDAGCSDPQHHRGDQPCLFWQDGEWTQWPFVVATPAIGARRIGKSRAGRLLDGRTHDDLPVRP